VNISCREWETRCESTKRSHEAAYISCNRALLETFPSSDQLGASSLLFATAFFSDFLGRRTSALSIRQCRGLQAVANYLPRILSLMHNAIPPTKPLLSSRLAFVDLTALCGVSFVSRLLISESIHKINLQVYLDSQHVDWMSDRVLRQVVADLRPK
jgi:hypothetical protein